MESTQNVYHVTRQNFHFLQAPYNKNKNKKLELRSGMKILIQILSSLDWNGGKLLPMGKNIFGKQIIICAK